MLAERRTNEMLSLRFTATFAEIRSALKLVVGSSYLADMSNARRCDFELVLAEALNNVAEHAYADTPNGEVRLTLSRIGDMLKVSIRDRGVEMKHRHAVEVPDDQPSEGGRGWLLINALCRSARYERRASTNRLSLEFLSSG